MNPIHLIIVTPQGLLVDRQVAKVFLPGSYSPFEVLKDHAPMISSLSKGSVRFFSEEPEEEQGIAIASGFVEVLDNTVTVAAEL